MGNRKARALCPLPFDFCLLIFIGCLLPPSGALAGEALHDPTRPPTVLYAPDGAAGTVNNGPVLQSVLISEGRRSAIISGQNVKVGDKIGNARIIRINETEVVLKTGKSLQTLRLFPDVEKRTVVKNKRSKR